MAKSRKTNELQFYNIEDVEKKLEELLQQGLDPKESADRLSDHYEAERQEISVRKSKKQAWWIISLSLVFSIVMPLLIGFLMYWGLLSRLKSTDEKISAVEAQLSVLVATPLPTPAPINSSLSMQVNFDPPTLPVDGQGQSRVTIKLTDSQGNPVADGTTVHFDAPAWGSLEPLQASTQAGQVQVVFTANGSGPEPSGVSITARTTNNITATGTINLSQASPSLALDVRSNPDRNLQPNEGFNFMFTITNQGNGLAENVVLRSHVPDDVDLINLNGGQQEGGILHWDLENISSGMSVERSLLVRVKSDAVEGTPLGSPEVWVQCSNCQDVRVPPGQVTLLVAAPASPEPSRIVLAPEGSVSLSANGQNQITVAAEVLDQFEQPYPGTVTFSLEPSEGFGQLTTDGNRAVFTAGSQPGSGKIVTRFEEIVTEIPIDLTPLKYRFKEASKLYGNPDDRISSLPREMPIQEVVGQPQPNNYQKIAVSVWIPKTAITNTTSGPKIMKTNAQVFVGETPEDSLNPQIPPTFLDGIDEELIEILDEQSQPNHVKIRVLGWIHINNIQEVSQ